MITEDEIRRLALLARLDPSPPEVAKLQVSVGSVLQYVERLSTIALKEVPVMTHALSSSDAETDPNVLRTDKIEPSLPLEEALQNAPQSAVRFFKVPPAIAEDS